jgi:mono/diheme cytochrome c family protein
MKSWMLPMAIVSMTTVAALVALRAQEAPGGRSVWDGVYNPAQAKRGGQVYSVSCQNCHGDALQGDGTATALTGPAFMADFNGVTLGEMLDRTRTTMPDDNPGTMSRQQIADVLTYVLSVNKFPAGAAELPTQAEVLNQITFLATKPTGKTQERSRRRP